MDSHTQRIHYKLFFQKTLKYMEVIIKCLVLISLSDSSCIKRKPRYNEALCKS